MVDINDCCDKIFLSTKNPAVRRERLPGKPKSGESPDFGLDTHKSTAIRPQVKASAMANFLSREKQIQVLRLLSEGNSIRSVDPADRHPQETRSCGSSSGSAISAATFLDDMLSPTSVCGTSSATRFGRSSA